jgi:hypothetical protein
MVSGALHFVMVSGALHFVMVSGALHFVMVSGGRVANALVEPRPSGAP